VTALRACPARWPAIAVARAMFDIEVKGRLPPSGGVIVGHHRSYYDGVVLCATDARVRPVLRREYFADWRFSWYLRAVGAIPIQADTLSTAAAHLATWGVVLLAPAGFSPGEQLGQPRNGAAYLARSTGSPVIPTLVRGLEALPHLADFWRHGRRVAVTVHYGAPIHLPTTIPLREATAVWIEAVKHMYAELGEELETT
jgi:1-acyl-sn-glycerol-3-phosphate acyltransferase